MSRLHKPQNAISHKMKDFQVVSSFLSAHGKKKEWAKIACQLKDCGNHDLIHQSLFRISRSMPAIDDVIWGNTLPKDIRELGSGSNCYLFKPESLDNEINWLLLSLRKYKTELQNFVKTRQDVERAILLGQYDDASRMLEKIVKEIGHSVWYYEMKCVIYGAQDRFERIYELATFINKEKKDQKNGFVPYLISDLGNRSMHDVSAYEYDSSLYSRYKGARTEFQSDRYNYFLFRLNYYQHYDITSLSEVLIMESLNSIADRYSILLYVLRSYLIQQPDKVSLIHRYALKMFAITHDVQLYPFIALGDVSVLPDDYYNPLFVRILDAYYTGQYTSAADLCREYIQSAPSDFSVIKIYCRALLFLKNGYRPIVAQTDSFVNHIAYNIYKVMTDAEKDQALDRLYQLSKNIYGFQMAAALDCFVRQERNASRCEALPLLTITHFDPLYTSFYSDQEPAIRYLESALPHVSNSVALSYQINRARKIVTEDTSVVAYIRNVDNAKIVFENGEYEKALCLWEDIFDNTKQYIPTAQTAVDYIFRSYVSLGENSRRDAVRFFVETYIENKAFVSKVNTSDFIDDIKKSRYQGLKIGLDLLIFVFLNAENYPQKQFVLDRYCKYENVNYPSELFTKLQRRNPEKVKLFYTILLHDDILFYHYRLKSTIDVLDEKLKIVSFLRNQYPDDKQYAETYTELMHELIAYRGMKKLDDSKIYVNQDDILKYELNDIADLYDRFHKLVANTAGKVYFLVDTIDWSNDEMLTNAATYSDNAVAEVATQLFSVIRRAFLKSRFGLGTYLSTRIRHGVFEGELRSCLERLNLVYKTVGSQYVPTVYWKHEFHLDENNSRQLNDCIISFSRSIDNLISYFKDSVIQIHVDENDPSIGDFNYELSSKEICQAMTRIDKESSSAEDFCNRTMEHLWQITERCLTEIRRKIHDELRPTFTTHIRNLQNKTNNLSSHQHLKHELDSTINNALEELSGRLTKVEKWFNRQTAKFEDFQLQDHINMAINTIGDYTGVSYELKANLGNARHYLLAEYNPSMFDLLTILFNNMLQYSKPESVRHLNLETAILPGNIQHLHFENALPDGTDEKELNRTFEARLKSIKSLQSEGGSGLIKALNIVKYDFGNPSNTFDIIAQDGKCLVDVKFNLDNMLVRQQVSLTE